MLTEIIFEHTIGIHLIVAAVTGCLLLGAYSFLRHLGLSPAHMLLAVIRLLFIALLTWCLLLPALREATRHVVKPRFLVLLDTSRSMTLTPSEQVTTRWQVARELLSQPWIRILGAQAEVDLHPFDIEPAPRLDPGAAIGLTPEGEATHLRASLRRIVDLYRGQNLAGVLLLSDGLDTRETTGDWAHESWPCPIYTVRLEPPDLWEVEPDIRVDAVNTPRRVVVDWDSELSAMISGQGTHGAMIPVQLLKDDILVQEIPTMIPHGGGSREVLFRLQHDTVGHHTYTVNLPPLPGESNTNDNFFSVNVLVTDARNRLLYVEGVPRWESKYLNRVLRANSLVTPLAFVRGPDGQFLTYGERGSITTDMTEAELQFFKILIIGDLDAAELGEERAANLVKFVEDGGSLVVLGGVKTWGPNGLQSTPLNRLLPLRDITAAPAAEGRFPVYPAESGMQHPVINDLIKEHESLPPLLSYFQAGAPGAGATVLAEVEDAGIRRPLAAVQRYGHGKVAAILTDSLWRWQLHPGEGDPYAAFWNALIAWMAPSETEIDEHQVDLFADADQLFMGETIMLQARAGSRDTAALSGLSATCEIQSPAGRRLPFRMRPQTVTTATGHALPGFAVSFSPEEPGLYRAYATVAIGDDRTQSAPFSFYVRPYTPESNPRPVNVELLTALSHNSQGRFLEPEQIDAYLSALNLKSDEDERVSYKSLWNNAWIIAGLILLLSADWTIRKFNNMP